MRVRSCIHLAISLVMVLGCSPRNGDDNRIVVAVSVPPQAEFVERIGGERVRALIMVPPGANPHTYEPAPDRIARLSEAAAYIKAGSGIEFELAWLDRLVSMNREMLVVDASEGIEAGGSGPAGALDPHVWVSPRNAMIMIDNTYRGLVAVDPGHREYYAARRDRYREELAGLDRAIEQLFAAKTDRTFIVYHPAWGHLARDYGLEQVAIEEEGKEPTARGIVRVIGLARELGIRTVFVSPQFDTRSAEVIAREIGGSVTAADPLARDYIANMRSVTAAFAGEMK